MDLSMGVLFQETSKNRHTEDIDSVAVNTQRHGARDGADRDIIRRSARRVALQVAALCASMVVTGAALFFLALWLKAGDAPDPSEPNVTVSVDVVDFSIAGLVLGIAAVVLAGAAGFLFARRANQPVEEALERQHNFIADASHELRTPLSVMHLRVQKLEMLTRGDERVRPVVVELRRDTRRMVDIVDDLLSLATATADADATANLADALVALETGADVVVHNAVAKDAHVRLAPVALERCLTALVTNAKNYARSTVQVNARAVGDSVVVRVSDDGPGIQGIEPQRIFDRFAHGTGGAGQSHGIGLALVRDSVTRAGGRVAVEHTGPGGTTIAMTMLRAEGEHA